MPSRRFEFNNITKPRVFKVPDNVFKVNIRVEAAQGGNTVIGPPLLPISLESSGGLGARVQGDFDVTPGESLSLIVGQRGKDTVFAAMPGGGFYVGIASGGGGSFVWRGERLDPSQLLVAAGGGGGSASGNGGDGGALGQDGRKGESNTTLFPGTSGGIGGSKNGGGGVGSDGMASMTSSDLGGGGGGAAVGPGGAGGTSTSQVPGGGGGGGAISAGQPGQDTINSGDTPGAGGGAGALFDGGAGGSTSTTAGAPGGVAPFGGGLSPRLPGLEIEYPDGGYGGGGGGATGSSGGGGGYGGGASGAIGGAGGGSSFIDPSATNVSSETGAKTGDGLIIITWVVTPPIPPAPPITPVEQPNVVINTTKTIDWAIVQQKVNVRLTGLGRNNSNN